MIHYLEACANFQKLSHVIKNIRSIITIITAKEVYVNWMPPYSEMLNIQAYSTL